MPYIESNCADMKFIQTYAFYNVAVLGISFFNLSKDLFNYPIVPVYDT